MTEGQNIFGVLETEEDRLVRLKRQQDAEEKAQKKAARLAKKQAERLGSVGISHRQP